MCCVRTGSSSRTGDYYSDDEGFGTRTATLWVLDRQVEEYVGFLEISGLIEQHELDTVVFVDFTSLDIIQNGDRIKSP